MFPRISLLALALVCLLPAGESNTLSPQEAAAGFRLLFDGVAMEGWSASKNNWHVNLAALHLRHKGSSIAWTKEKLARDFELRFEWMAGPEGNSGVLDAPEWADILAKERNLRLEIPAPGPAREGFLALSDHCGTVWFRSIRLKVY